MQVNRFENPYKIENKYITIKYNIYSNLKGLILRFQIEKS